MRLAFDPLSKAHLQRSFVVPHLIFAAIDSNKWRLTLSNSWHISKSVSV